MVLVVLVAAWLAVADAVKWLTHRRKSPPFPLTESPETDKDDSA
jgi:hypothetical protein